MKPDSIPTRSCSTFASGATQFVVHEAFETMWCASGSYASSLTPSTIVTSGSVAGAEITTFFAPASRCFCAPVAVGEEARSTRGRRRRRDRPTAAPPGRARTASCISVAAARMHAVAELDLALERAERRVVPAAGAPSSSASPRSFSRDDLEVGRRAACCARKKLRPMRPKPLMPTRIAMRLPSRWSGAVRSVAPAYRRRPASAGRRRKSEDDPPPVYRARTGRRTGSESDGRTRAQPERESTVASALRARRSQRSASATARPRRRWHAAFVAGGRHRGELAQRSDGCAAAARRPRAGRGACRAASAAARSRDLRWRRGSCGRGWRGPRSRAGSRARASPPTTARSSSASTRLVGAGSARAAPSIASAPFA